MLIIIILYVIIIMIFKTRKKVDKVRKVTYRQSLNKMYLFYYLIIAFRKGTALIKVVDYVVEMRKYSTLTKDHSVLRRNNVGNKTGSLLHCER